MSTTTIIPQVSAVFCCRACGAPVALVLLNADDLGYACQNERCQKVVNADCPEALAVIDEQACGVAQGFRRMAALLEVA